MKSPEDSQPQGRISKTIRVDMKVIFLPEHQTMVSVTKKIFGFIYVTPFNYILDIHSIVSMNFMDFETEMVPFIILIGKYGSKP